MGLTFFQQLLTVAGLAFSSGLLLGVAFFRGEIGELGRARPSSRFAAPAPAAPGAARPRAPKRRLRPADMRKALVSAVRDIDPALLWVLIALAFLLTASAAITRLAA